jgi:hypothetical protein
VNHAHVVIGLVAAFAAGQASVLAVLWALMPRRAREEPLAAWRHRAAVLPPPQPAREAVPASGRGELGR